MTKLIVSACLLAAGAPALAEQPTTVTGRSPYSENVSYKVQTLATGAGEQDLRRRVRAAAHRVCAPGEDAFRANYVDRCYWPTMQDANAQIDQAIGRIRNGTQVALASSVVVRAR